MLETNSRLLRTLSLLALVASSACSTSEAKPSHGDDHQACIDVSVRSRTCTDPFVAGLVDTRAKHDIPAGIAASVRSDRAGVIAQAKREWANDSTDAAIESTCKGPDAAHIAATRDCLQRPDCAGFVACVLPSFEAALQRQAHK